MSAVEPKQPDRSLADLFSTLTSDITLLVRKELELAREELKGEASVAGKAVGALGAAAIVGLLAGIALVMTLGFALDAAMPAWAAFLIVTIVLGIVAAVLGTQGQKRLKAINPKPEQTITTLKEDKQWLSEQRS